MKIIKMGHPKLRRVAKFIFKKDLKKKKNQKLIDELIKTMRAENGAGIAAPQSVN